MGTANHLAIDSLQAKQIELSELLARCQTQVNDLTTRLEDAKETPDVEAADLTAIEKLLEAAETIMGSVTADLMTLQDHVLSAMKKRTKAGTLEVSDVKCEIAALEATRQRLDTSMATTQHNFEAVDSVIDGHLRSARKRLATLISGTAITNSWG